MSLIFLYACTDYNLSAPGEEVKEEVPEDTAPEEQPPGDDPEIEVSPSSIDFGSVMKDCPADPITVTITNKGLGQLEVRNIDLDGDAVSKFSHDGQAVNLEYNDTYEFDIEFEPSAYVTYEVELQVESNDPDEGLVGVPVLGAGASGSIYEESFVQDYHDTIDVLWVIDNSGSMSEEVDRLKDQFDLFIAAFLTLGLDYHIGVVTTDMDNGTQSGKLQGTPIYIESSTADPVAAFKNRAGVGSGGSGDEQGLAAAKAALTDPLASGDNAGFLRADSAVSIVVVSDENDSSSISASSFASWLDGLQGDVDLSSLSAIVGDRGLGCTEIDWSSGDTVSATGGDKYIDVADATGGFFASICTEDFDVAVTNIAKISAGMQAEWELSKTPSDISLMEVYVDGIEVPYDATDGWIYDSADNAVEFHGTAVPDAGEVIEVSYPYDSSCN
ncbi:MAG: hypothetical protein FJ090_20850 [Deltaproteobacteria bacterium]|nr:hypothetical protein [Deltaproteobacteria bacterium]MBM4393581.1 hypothetical protein [Deltaproteobacteria bacterium]